MLNTLKGDLSVLVNVDAEEDNLLYGDDDVKYVSVQVNIMVDINKTKIKVKNLTYMNHAINKYQ